MGELNVEDSIFLISDQWERKIRPFLSGPNGKTLMMEFLKRFVGSLLKPLVDQEFKATAATLLLQLQDHGACARLASLITEQMVHETVMRIKAVKAAPEGDITIVANAEMRKLGAAAGIEPAQQQQQEPQEQQQQLYQVQPAPQAASEEQENDENEIEGNCIGCCASFCNGSVSNALFFFSVIEEVRGGSRPLRSTAPSSSTSVNPDRSPSPESPPSLNTAILKNMLKSTMEQYNKTKKVKRQAESPVATSESQTTQSRQTADSSEDVQARALAVLSGRWHHAHTSTSGTDILDALQGEGELLLRGDVTYQDFVRELVAPLKLNQDEVALLNQLGCDKTKEWLRSNIDVDSSLIGPQVPSSANSSASGPNPSPAKTTAVTTVVTRPTQSPAKPSTSISLASKSTSSLATTAPIVSPAQSTAPPPLPLPEGILPRYVFKYKDEFFVRPPTRNERLVYTVLVLQEPGKEDNLVFVFTKHQMPNLAAGEAVTAESVAATIDGALLVKLVFGGKPIQVCLIRTPHEFRMIFLNEPNNQVKSSLMPASTLQRLTLQFERSHNLSYLPYDYDAFRGNSRLFSSSKVRSDIVCKCVLGEPKVRFREQFRHRFGFKLADDTSYTAIVLEYVVFFFPSGLSISFVDLDREVTLDVDTQMNQVCFGEDEDTIQVSRQSLLS